MTAYSVDIPKMESLVLRAWTVGDALERRVSEVEQTVEDLHIDWHGDCAEQHRANAQAWHRSMNEMRSALAELRAAVDAARNSYSGNVGHNQRMWP